MSDQVGPVQDLPEPLRRRSRIRPPSGLVLSALLALLFATFVVAIVVVRQELLVGQATSTVGVISRSPTTVPGLSPTAPAVVLIQDKAPSATATGTASLTPEPTMTPLPPTETPTPIIVPPDTDTATVTVTATSTATATTTTPATSTASSTTVPATLPPAPPTHGPTGVIQAQYGGGAVVRSAPTENAQQVGFLQVGAPVTVLGVVRGQAIDPAETRWWHVQAGALSGYVYYKLVRLT